MNIGDIVIDLGAEQPLKGQISDIWTSKNPSKGCVVRVDYIDPPYHIKEDGNKSWPSSRQTTEDYHKLIPYTPISELLYL